MDLYKLRGGRCRDGKLLPNISRGGKKKRICIELLRKEENGVSERGE